MMDKEITTLHDDQLEPWLIDQRSFFPSEKQENLSGNFEALKENHTMLTLVTARGRVYENAMVIGIEKGRLQVDRPLEWAENGDSFRIFCRDQHGCCCFFYSVNTSTGPFSISLDMPGRIFYLQRRRDDRIALPAGARALVRKSGNHPECTVLVVNISPSGLLFTRGTTADQFPVYSFVRDIVVSVPPRQEKAGAASSRSRRLLPQIPKGRVVRTSVDRKTRRRFFGISFDYDDKALEEKISRGISDIAGGE